MGKKLYSPAEFYRILYHALRTRKYLAAAKKSSAMSTPFIERLMLAVTEVNQCPLCSYEHTKIALEAGMENGEIQSLLAGSADSVPKEETAAVLFAQHYADSRGKPSPEAWKRIAETYGKPEAMGILGAVRIIMLGNAFGIVLNSLKGRRKGKPDERSSPRYEISMLLAFLPFLLWAGAHAGIANLLRLPDTV